MTAPIKHPSERIPAELLKTNDGKFKPKLDEHDRLRALASVRSGIKKDIVAAAFGIDRRTISHMTNPFSPHYKALREKELVMGPNAFILEYFDETALERIKKATLPPKDGVVDDGIPKPNARSKAKAGVNVVKPDQCKYNHRIHIAFRHQGDYCNATGWWYQDMDGPDPTEWYRGDDASLMTSNACLNAAMEAIYDA